VNLMLFLVIFHFLAWKNACHVHFFADESKKCALNLSSSSTLFLGVKVTD
jgi:hypothetical protein